MNGLIEHFMIEVKREISLIEKTQRSMKVEGRQPPERTSIRNCNVGVFRKLYNNEIRGPLGAVREVYDDSVRRAGDLRRHEEMSRVIITCSDQGTR